MNSTERKGPLIVSIEDAGSKSKHSILERQARLEPNHRIYTLRHLKGHLRPVPTPTSHLNAAKGFLEQARSKPLVVRRI